MQSIKDAAFSFHALLQKHRKVTILSHINPDADAIGTALGIYSWLKEQKYQVEVVNASKDIPLFLDFLPHFSKIKQRMDFDNSLIIACDSGSRDRLGYDLEDSVIVNIDHHSTNTNFGVLNIVDPSAVSSSEVAFQLLKSLEHPVSRESAIAFYAALVSDTRNFTTNNMHQGIFALASQMVGLGIDIAEVSQKMLHRRSLASLRILGTALQSLELRESARIAILKISQEDIKHSGAKMSDLDGVVDYAKSLATVEIAMMLVERKGEIKVSLRSKNVDVAGVALVFGGGGHNVAAGFEVKGNVMTVLVDAIIEEISRQGLLK